MFENVCRVVTVIDDDGISRVESDGPPPQVTRHPTGTVLTEAWTIDAIPVAANAPGDRDEYSFLSPPQGIVFRRVEVQPDAVRFVDHQGNPRDHPPCTRNQQPH